MSALRQEADGGFPPTERQLFAQCSAEACPETDGQPDGISRRGDFVRDRWIDGPEPTWSERSAPGEYLQTFGRVAVHRCELDRLGGQSLEVCQQTIEMVPRMMA